MTKKRILTIILCVFFLLIGTATSTRHDGWERTIERITREIRQLEIRRDSLMHTIEELEQRCKEVEGRISEQEDRRGDENEKDTIP